MKTFDRDLLVMLKHSHWNEKLMDLEIQSLNEILKQVESPQQFCTAHELVDRNYITSRPKSILKAIRFAELKPFRFLISKN
jgi:hypothetical protein